jgi:hypothetical protein
MFGNRRGRGTCVDWWTETAKLCKGKRKSAMSALGLDIIIIIIIIIIICSLCVDVITSYFSHFFVVILISHSVFIYCVTG